MTAPRIFVSSVMATLRGEREAARSGVVAADCVPVLAEDFPAGPASPQETCLDEVRRSDGLVLVLGSDYGNAPSPSMTEQEYLAAREADVPVFAIVTTAEPSGIEQERFRRQVLNSTAGQYVAFYAEGDNASIQAAARRALDTFFHPADPAAVARAANTFLYLLELARILFDRVSGEGGVGPLVGSEARQLAQLMDDRRDAIGDEALRRAVVQVIHQCGELWSNQPGFGQEHALDPAHAAQAQRASEAAARGWRAASRAIRRCHFFGNAYPGEFGEPLGSGVPCQSCGRISCLNDPPACPYCGAVIGLY